MNKCELCGREMPDGWCEYCWKDYETAIDYRRAVKSFEEMKEVRNEQE